MNDSDRRRLILKTTLNQCFCDFGVKTFTKRYLNEMVEQDSETLFKVLREWENRKFLNITRPIETAQESDICVEVLLPIEGSPYRS